MRRVVIASFLFACGTSSPAGKDGGADVSTQPDVDLQPLDGSPSECSDQAKRVYLVSTQNDLWSFDPGTLAFQKIGALDCPTTSTPESLGVDRTAHAWVGMMDGMLFEVDTGSAHCTPTSYALAQNDRKIFDLAFSTSGASETLFTSTTCCYDDAGNVNVTNHGGGGLATIAMPSLSLSLVGDYTSGLDGYPCALAGTGDGRLFGFFPNVNQPDGGVAQILAQIDKTSGATPSPITLSSAVHTGAAFAFSFWGGDFWFYAANGSGTSSDVTRFRYSTNQTYDVVVLDTGMTIIGAGVSTCAPLVSPN